MTKLLMSSAGSSTAANYIEDVFSTYLYTGNSSTQTITNGINLSTNGGLVWIKNRTNAGAVSDHVLLDTVRGPSSALSSNLTSAAVTGYLSSFDSSGFTLLSTGGAKYNYSTAPYVSWTFRKQAKFFDVVTWTGNGGTSGRTITHNLGSVPGCIIVKKYSGTAEDWCVYPASLGNTGTKQYFLILNSTAAQDTGGNGIEKSSNWTSTQFAIASGSSALNGSGQSYVAYLFAHNAGGFGLTGNDNVISCGSYTGNGSSNGPVINLGWEPQWVLIKRADASGTDWTISDNMRGLSVVQNTAVLVPNSAAAESSTAVQFSPNATGFQLISAGATYNQNAGTYIYIAIRRGPMKVPTSGTSVFYPTTRSGTSADATVTGASFPPDLLINATRTGGYYGETFLDRLRGPSAWLYSSSIQLEQSASDGLISFNMNGVSIGADTNVGFINNTGVNYAPWMFGRAPSFCDVVCYTGTGVARTVNHNLSVAPELMIVKVRSTTNDWAVYSSGIANTEYLLLDTISAKQTNVNFWNSTSPTASVFTVGTRGEVNTLSATYVAYLFATCPGVSKVGSYTGTGATQTINCGFTGGARFVLIKRTDSTGGWYVWDTARGMVSGTDPSLLLNDNNSEVNANSVYTTGVGFQIVSTAAGINASGGSYIFLAVA